MYNFDPYNVLLAIATNIPVLLMTAFVLQRHIFNSLFSPPKKDAHTGIKILILQQVSDSGIDFWLPIMLSESECVLSVADGVLWVIRWSPSRGREDLRRLCVPLAEVRGRHAPGPEDSWSGSVVSHAAHSHGNHDGRSAAAAQPRQDTLLKGQFTQKWQFCH